MTVGPTRDLDHDSTEELAPFLDRLFDIEITEGSWPLEVNGEIPDYLNGSYYLNGPASFRRGDLAYEHWLDGDGAVARVYFSNGEAQLTYRYVASAKRQQEDAAGRSLFRAFGTAFEGDQLKRGIALESPLNVSVYRFGEDLLAFGEQGLPYALDPVTLDTHGEHTFGGRLNDISPLSAHPCFDADSGDMVCFGTSFSARQPSMTIYRFSAEGELIGRRRSPLPYPCSTHDFVISKHFIAAYLSPYVLDVEMIMKQGKSVMDALSWRPELGSKLAIFDRQGAPLAHIDLDVGYCLHLINAFDDGERLTVGLVELERPVYDQYHPLPDLFVDAPSGGPRRYVIDVEAGEVVDKRAIHYDLCPDFPAIDPRRAQHEEDDFWLLGITQTGERGRKFFDQLAHLRWSDPEARDVYSAPPGCYFGGEPVFLGDPGDERRGSVLIQQLDAEAMESWFLLFDAFDVAQGPVATLRVPDPMPLGFHASYHPD